MYQHITYKICIPIHGYLVCCICNKKLSVELYKLKSSTEFTNAILTIPFIKLGEVDNLIIRNKSVTAVFKRKTKLCSSWYLNYVGYACFLMMSYQLANKKI